MAANYQPLAISIARSYAAKDGMLDPEEARGIAIEGLVVAAKRWKAKRRAGLSMAFPNFVRLVIKRRLLDYATKVRRASDRSIEIRWDPKVLDQVASAETDEYQPDPELWSLFQRRLDRKTFIIIHQRFVQDMSLSDMAKRYRLSPSATRRRLMIALEEVRKVVEGIYDHHIAGDGKLPETQEKETGVRRPSHNHRRPNGGW